MTGNLNIHREGIRRLFARVAPHYDRMNWWMTLGQDQRWRREVLRRAGLAPAMRFLDLGAGTGELARAALDVEPNIRLLAVDLTPEMIRLGRARLASRKATWVRADALHLPFPSATIDAVVSAFLLRNVSELDVALREQNRVLRPGGKMVALDTTPPRGWLRPLLRFYLRRVVPSLARLVTGDVPAYNYLAASTEGFVPAMDLAHRLTQAGFRQVGYVRRSFGAVAIHWGIKP